MDGKVLLVLIFPYDMHSNLENANIQDSKKQTLGSKVLFFLSCFYFVDYLFILHPNQSFPSLPYPNSPLLPSTPPQSIPSLLFLFTQRWGSRGYHPVKVYQVAVRLLEAHSLVLRLDEAIQKEEQVPVAVSRVRDNPCFHGSKSNKKTTCKHMGQ